ncbi:MAG: hypothetical protein R3F43_11405 [bacterium]
MASPGARIASERGAAPTPTAPIRASSASSAPPWTPFAGSCTRACQVDADCSGDAVCLRTADSGICGDGCTRDGHCRAEEGFRCVTGTDCVGREDEAACQAMLGARRVCARL